MKRENHYVHYSKYETADTYDRDRAAKALPLRKAASQALLPRMSGSILIAGWSPEIQITPPSAERIVVADFSPNVLRSVPQRENLSTVCAEVDRLPFDIGTFDVVLASDMLHHLAEDDTRETDRALRSFISGAANVMAREGSLFIFEPLVNQFLETANRALFQAARVLMNNRGIPTPCYISLASLRETIRDAGMIIASVEHIPVPGDYMLTPKYPDYTIPYGLLPIKFYLIECKKKL